MAAVMFISLATTAQWKTVTVYDVLPEDCRFAVGNNDVGDPPGDMYFNTKDKYLPIACLDCQTKPGGCKHDSSVFDCTNVESTGALVVRKITVEVNGIGEGYQLCDVWDHSKKCVYSCFDPHHGHGAPGVGSEKVCGGGTPGIGGECNMAPTPSKFRHTTNYYDYWNYNVASLFGNTGNGTWFSLVSKDEGKYWRNATIVKTINSKCQARPFDAFVEQTGSECFNACPQPKNQTSRCWIECFFSTTLGPDADKKIKPPGQQTGAMKVEDLSNAWLEGFTSCPPCPATGPCPDVVEVVEEAEEGVVVASARHAPRSYGRAV